MELRLETVEFSNIKECLISVLSDVERFVLMTIEANPDSSKRLTPILNDVKRLEEDLRRISVSSLNDKRGLLMLNSALSLHKICTKCLRGEESIDSLIVRGASILSDMKSLVRLIREAESIKRKTRLLVYSLLTVILASSTLLSASLIHSPYEERAAISGNVAYSLILMMLPILVVLSYVGYIRCSQSPLKYLLLQLAIVPPLILSCATMLLALHGFAVSYMSLPCSLLMLLATLTLLAVTVYLETSGLTTLLLPSTFRLSLARPIPVSRGAPIKEVELEPLYAKLRQHYTSIYGESGEEILAYEVNVLTRHGVSLREALIEIARRHGIETKS